VFSFPESAPGEAKELRSVPVTSDQVVLKSTADQEEDQGVHLAGRLQQAYLCTQEFCVWCLL